MRITGTYVSLSRNRLGPSGATKPPPPKDDGSEARPFNGRDVVEATQTEIGAPAEYCTAAALAVYCTAACFADTT